MVWYRMLLHILPGRLATDSKTRLESIADKFVVDYLQNNPIMVYSLDIFLED
jgi:hypothetical protein